MNCLVGFCSHGVLGLGHLPDPSKPLNGLYRAFPAFLMTEPTEIPNPAGFTS
jgi:hypothetical protein